MNRLFPDLLPGDVIGFSAHDCSGVLINLTTWGLPRVGWSHVGIVAEHDGELLLFESTMLLNRPCALSGVVTNGVQAHPVAARVKSFPGKVWRCPLRRGLDERDSRRLTRYGLDHLGTGYDALGAFRSRGLSLIERFVLRKEDLATVFCSEFVAGALRHVERFWTQNASRLNPNRLRRALHTQGAITGEVMLKPKRRLPPARD